MNPPASRKFSLRESIGSKSCFVLLCLIALLFLGLQGRGRHAINDFCLHDVRQGSTTIIANGEEA
jgi:hypothetical protein